MEDIRAADIKLFEGKANKPSWVADLEKKGYAIVPNVISADKAEEYYSRFWDWMEGFGNGLKRNKKNTWGQHWPFNAHGIIQHYAIGQEQFIWDMRMERSVIDVFEQLWGTRELLVSFDGANLSQPQRTAEKTWEHVDQSPDKKGFHCVQGLVNLLENSADDGGLVVYEGSHLLHEDFFKKHNVPLSGGDWYMFSQTNGEMDFYKDCKKTKICCNPGDMLLWDSRTVHFASTPTGRKFRSCIYICMTPATWATDAAIKMKRRAFEEKRMTNHWPHDPELFELHPRGWSEDDDKKFPVSKKMPAPPRAADPP